MQIYWKYIENANTKNWLGILFGDPEISSDESDEE